jgi:hypothetical protein
MPSPNKCTFRDAHFNRSVKRTDLGVLPEHGRRMPLARDAIHIWRTVLPAMIPVSEELKAAISADEVPRSGKFLFPDLQKGIHRGTRLLANDPRQSLQLRTGGLVLLLRRLSKASAQIERPPFANSSVQPFSFSRRSPVVRSWALRDRREIGPGREGSREHRQDEDARNWLPKRYFLSSPYLVE